MSEDRKIFAEGVLADRTRREEIKERLNGKIWEMRVLSSKDGFCFLRHPDFAGSVFCLNKRLSGGDVGPGARCRVEVEVTYNSKKESFGYAVKRGTVFAAPPGGGGENTARRSAAGPGAPGKFRKENAGAGAPKEDDPNSFYTSREAFFKASRMGRDEDALAVFLNAAVTNICGICKELSDNFKPEKAAQKILNDLTQERLEKLASFLFLFLPAVRDRSGYRDSLRENCAFLVGKVFELRDFFSHSRELKEELRIADERFPFFGKLVSEMAVGSAGNAQVVASVPLSRKIVEETGPKEFSIHHELTKHGIIFICCMALDKDQAHQFCGCLSGMRPRDLNAEILTKYFSHFSFPRGRQIGFGIDKDNPGAEKAAFSSDIKTFAEISGYLNKVPEVCRENLLLNSERERLKQQMEQSNACEDHIESRFRLQERAGNKFATYALCWLEDFQRLPHFGFKHLDLSFGYSPDNYAFDRQAGKFPSERHFVVNNGSVHFEWRLPESKPHHGSVEIAALNGTFTEDMLQQLFYLSLGPEGMDLLPEALDRKLSEWMEAYHAFLEKVLDRAAQRLPLRHTDFLPELSTLAGVPESAVREDFFGTVSPVIGTKLAGYFESAPGPLPADERETAIRKIRTHREHARELERQFRTGLVPDQVLIRLVFEFFDLRLAGTPWAFRLLPTGQQHRGCIDYEYQTVHALIGQYTLDPKALWKFFRKMAEKGRAKSIGKFMDATHLSQREVYGFCKSREELLEFCRKLKRTQTLRDLAFAALSERIRIESSWLGELEEEKIPEEWDRIKALYGIREACGTDPDDIFRTVLKIDRRAWEHAYDYEAKAPASGRDLGRAKGLVVPQIVLPAWLIPSVLDAPEFRKTLENSPRAPWDGKLQRPDIRLGIRRMTLPVKLREYYNIETLVQWLKDNVHSRTRMQVCSSQRSRINKVCGDIRRVHAEDTLLGMAAWRYWEREHASGRRTVFSDLEEGRDFYNFYVKEIPYRTGVDGKTIGVRIADLNKPVFARLTENAVVRALFREDPASHCSFGEAQTRLKRIEASDLRIRLQYARRVLSFYENAPEPPKFERPEGISKSEWAGRELYRKIADFLIREGYAAGLEVDEVVRLLNFRNALMHHEHLDLEPEFQPLEQIEPALKHWEEKNGVAE